LRKLRPTAEFAARQGACRGLVAPPKPEFAAHFDTTRLARAMRHRARVQHPGNLS
jgi:hypothetical protein